MDPRILPDVLIFLEVVRAGSISRAARRLNTVQSNVTARMRILEDSVGTPLLRRHARGVKPTAAGEAALALALRLDTVMDDLRLTFGAARKLDSVKLRLGAIETVAARHLPSVIAEFVRSCAQVDVSVQTGSSAALMRQLRDGDLDVVFSSRRSGHAGLREGPAFRDELILLTPTAAASVSSFIASQVPPLKILVQRLGCSYTERFLTLLAQEGGRDYRLLEIGTLEGIVGLVEAGVGIAVMPRAFAQTVSSTRTRHLLLPRELRSVVTYFAAPSSSDSSRVVNDFVGMLMSRKGALGRDDGTVRRSPSTRPRAGYNEHTSIVPRCSAVPRTT